MSTALNSLIVQRVGVFFLSALEVVLIMTYVKFLRTRRIVSVRLLGAVMTVTCFIVVLLAQRKVLLATGGLGLGRSGYDLLVTLECGICFIILLYGLARSRRTTQPGQKP